MKVKELTDNEVDFIIQSATFDELTCYDSFDELEKDFEKEHKLYLSPANVLNIINNAFAYGVMKGGEKSS